MQGENDEQPTRPGTMLLNGDERLHCFIEAAEDYAFITLDPAGCVADWNSAAQRLVGWPDDQVVGKPAALFLPAIRVPGPSRQETACIRADASRFQARLTINPFHHPDGTPRAYAITIRDISGPGFTAADRPDARPWLTTTIDSAMDAIITVDAAQRIILFNKAAEALFGCSAAEVQGQKLERFIPRRFRKAHADHIEQFGATGVTSRAMGHLGTLSGVKSNGGEFPIEASISQTQVNGEKLFTVILRDITQRKRAEERQSLLLLELAHRVKNTLAIVQSIVAQTRRYATPKAFHEALTGRLIALGSAHDLLGSSDWAGAALADVVRLAFAPYASHGAADRWTADGPAIWLASNEAVTLSLVFHELVANATKYGSLVAGPGTVTVAWALEPDVDPTTVTVLWREQGGPPVLPPTRRGFGSRLIRQAIAHELGGSSTLSFLPAGTQCTLTLPLSQKVHVR
jgi:PAS domain S-box-containing protein